MCRVKVVKDCLEPKNFFIQIDGVLHYSLHGSELGEMHLHEPLYTGPFVPMREWPDGLKQNIIKRMEDMKNAR